MEAHHHIIPYYTLQSLHFLVGGKLLILDLGIYT